MNYTEIEAYIEAHQDIGSIYGLERIEVLLDYLNHPEKDLKIIHVAGTNGKGSTCAFINNILQKSGYETVAYISPALFDYREKFLVNRQPVVPDVCAQAMSTVIEQCQKMADEPIGHPTVFEMEIACAYVIAKNLKIETFIQETGLGGRLDATNTVQNPILTIITSISKDHMHLLGNTLVEIAQEKAGIIKKHCPLILYDNGPEVNQAILNVAKEKEAPVKLITFDTKAFKIAAGKTILSVDGKDYILGLNGLHQCKNALIALNSVMYLAKEGYLISQEAISSGLAETQWPCRFEAIGNNPRIYLDGAHNEDSVRILMQNLEKFHPHSFAQRIFVLHMFADKDVDKMLSLLKGCAQTVICTSIDSPRSLSAHALYQKAQETLPESRCYEIDALDEAIHFALKQAQKESIVCIFGSLSHLEIARKYVKDERYGYKEN